MTFKSDSKSFGIFNSTAGIFCGIAYAIFQIPQLFGNETVIIKLELEDYAVGIN